MGVDESRGMGCSWKTISLEFRPTSANLPIFSRFLTIILAKEPMELFDKIKAGEFTPDHSAFARPKCRGNLNTNFFYLKLFGHRRDIPAKSRDIPPKKFDFPGFEGHTELFGLHPFMWKTPTPLENIWTQKFGFVLFFRA